MRYLLFYVLGIISILTTSAIVVRVYNFQDGQILRASQLNAEFNNIVANMNNLNQDNLSPAMQLPPNLIDANIAGPRLDRDVSGQLSVAPYTAAVSTGGINNVVSSTPFHGTVTGSTLPYSIGSASLTTRGGVVQVTFAGVGSVANPFQFPVCTSNDASFIVFNLSVGADVVAFWSIMFYDDAGSSPAVAPYTVFLDLPAGTHSISLEATSATTDVSCSYYGSALLIREL